MNVRYEPAHRELYEMALLAREEFGDGWLEPVRRWVERKARRLVASAEPAGAAAFAAMVRDEWTGRPEFDALQAGLRRLRREGLEDRVSDALTVLTPGLPAEGLLVVRTFAYSAASMAGPRLETDAEEIAQEPGMAGVVCAGANLAVWPVAGWQERLPATLREIVRQVVEKGGGER